MKDLTLTGISIGYDNHLIYECSSPLKMKEFREYLEPSEVELIDKVLLWFDMGDRKIFLKAAPERSQSINNVWVVKSEEIPGFQFIHSPDRNLLDEIEEKILSFHHNTFT